VTESPKLAEAIAALGLGVDAAEFHGGICGLLCTHGPGALSAWLDESRGAEASLIGDSAAMNEILHEAEGESWRELSGSELAFYPLLPDEEVALDERVAALASWCQGFVTGLGLGGYVVDDDRSTGASGAADTELAEIVGDFVEISRAGLSEEEQEQAHEADFDLAALIEYVRVGVQLIFEELQPQRERAATQRTH
jgi:hypothetical protein